MSMKMMFAAVGVLALLSGGVAHAQAPSAKPAAAAAKPRSAKSLECSKEADAKNLHGKPRKKFMSRCKKS